METGEEFWAWTNLLDLLIVSSAFLEGCCFFATQKAKKKEEHNYCQHPQKNNHKKHDPTCTWFQVELSSPVAIDTPKQGSATFICSTFGKSGTSRTCQTCSLLRTNNSEICSMKNLRWCRTCPVRCRARLETTYLHRNSLLRFEPSLRFSLRQEPCNTGT